MTALLPQIASFALAALAVAWVLAVVRLALGPTLADRAVALDLMATIVIAMAALASMVFDRPVLLDVAIVLALVAFVGTVAFGLYVERASREEGR